MCHRPLWPPSRTGWPVTPSGSCRPPASSSTWPFNCGHHSRRRITTAAPFATLWASTRRPSPISTRPCDPNPTTRRPAKTAASPAAPAYPEAYLNRSSAHRWAGNLEAACSASAQALRLNPKSDQAYLHRGAALHMARAFHAGPVRVCVVSMPFPREGKSLQERTTSLGRLLSKGAPCMRCRYAP
jgi:hypothetical protein